jgi:hypothetical protein
MTENLIPTPSTETPHGQPTLNYGEVFKKAFQITWKHKLLWLPLILLYAATMLYSIGMGINNRLFGNPGATNYDPEIMMQLMGMMGLLCVLAVFFGVIEIVLSISSKVIITQGVCQVEQGAATLSFRELLKSLKTYFWRLLGLDLLIGLMIALLVVPCSCLVGFMLTWSSLDVARINALSWIYYPLTLLLGPFLTGFIQQANLALIVENQGIIAALTRGWKIFTRFLGPILGIGFLLILISTGIVYLLGLLQNPLILRVSQMLFGGNDDLFQTVLSVVLLIVYLPVYSVLAAILGTFQNSAWTLVFLRLTRPAVSAGQSQ